MTDLTWQDRTVDQWADVIMADILADMRQPFPWGKQIPEDVPGFSELHDYCDANVYLLNRMGDGIAIYEDEADAERITRTVNAITDEISRRLAERAKTTRTQTADRPAALKCAYTKCRRVLRDGQQVVRVHPGELGASAAGPASAWGAMHAEHVSDANMRLAEQRDRVRTWSDNIDLAS
jgi:hypothetical protein